MEESQQLEFVFRNSVNSGWVIAILVVQLLLFGWIKVQYPKRLGLLLNAYISNRFVTQLNRDERMSEGIYNLIIEVNYVISLSLLFYIVNRNSHFECF